MLIGNIKMARNLIPGIFPAPNTVFNYTLDPFTRNGKIIFDGSESSNAGRTIDMKE